MTDRAALIALRDAENPTGFDDRLRELCRETCAEFGDPPCWRLPELVEPCEPISPCDDCLNAMIAKPQPVEYCPGCKEPSAWGDDLCPECLAVNNS